MLCQFTFKNYKSYKKETTIEMQAENIDEFKETLIESERDNKKYLPISIIYGPNAGGKSNALDALICMISSISIPIIAVRTKVVFLKNINIVPYKFSKVDEPTEFEVYFRIQKNEYRYNISYHNGKIIYESLYVLKENSKKPTKVFIRDEDNIELGEELKKEKVNNNNNIDIPFLSFLGISYDIETINLALNFFLNTSLLDCDINEFESSFEKFIIDNPKIKNKFIELLNNMDIDIVDYRLEVLDNTQGKIRIFTKHIVNGKEYELNLIEESKGTRKLFALLPRIIVSLMNGNLTVIDEMDAKLHPRLIKYIINMYKDKSINSKGAQLIISSQDLTTMTKDMLRRDEILFASKNKDDSSELYSLYEIRDTNGDHIRTTAAYNKQYMEGRYGADPYLKRILNWEVE
jgi:AAA15 family ATPase/GTPase